jgi:hypothetical protein
LAFFGTSISGTALFFNNKEIFMNSKKFSDALKGGLGVLAIALSSHSAFAAGDWMLNPTGSGSASASSLSALNVGGVGYIQFIPDALNPALYTFIEHGAYQSLNANRTGPFGASDLTVTYSATGSGSFIDPSALKITSGQVDLYSDANFDFATPAATYGADDGAHVGSFKISNGYVSGSDGTVTVLATGVTGSFAAGYLFDAQGADMSSAAGIQLVLTVLNQPSKPTPIVMSEIACGMAGVCTYNPFLPAMTAVDVGSVSISAVPEPESAAMLLAGLVLLAVVAHRRASSRDL